MPTEEAENEMIKILRGVMPPGMDFEWTDLKYQQILAETCFFGHLQTF